MILERKLNLLKATAWLQWNTIFKKRRCQRRSESDAAGVHPNCDPTDRLSSPFKKTSPRASRTRSRLNAETKSRSLLVRREEELTATKCWSSCWSSPSAPAWSWALPVSWAISFFSAPLPIQYQWNLANRCWTDFLVLIFCLEIF